MLLVNLDQTSGNPRETILNIPQIESNHDTIENKEETLSFKRDYGEEDILYSLEEIFPANVATL